MQANDNILAAGFRLLGLKEVPGVKYNPKIITMLKRILPWAASDEINWCGAAMHHTAVEAGAELTGKRLYGARNWCFEGRAVEAPIPGDVAVFWRIHPTRAWQGHVGIYLNEDEDGYIWIMGGNQLNEYNVQKRHKKYLICYRRLFVKAPL